MKIDFGVDIIYVINLKKHINRRENIEHLFSTYNITNFEFIEAYDGEELPSISNLIEEKILNTSWVDPGGLFTKNIVGCAMSHKKTIEIFTNSDYNTCLILEDDIKFTDDLFKSLFNGKFETLKEQIKTQNPDIFFWGHYKPTLLKSTQYSEIFEYPRFHREFSAHAYQINKFSAQYLLDNYYPIKLAADVYLDCSNLNIFTSHQPLIIQSRGNIPDYVIGELHSSILKINQKNNYTTNSSTSGEIMMSPPQIAMIENGIEVDYILFRNFKTDRGELMINWPIIYFKK